MTASPLRPLFGRAPILLSLSLSLAVAGALPAGAQTREVVVRRTVRADSVDATERQVRVQQRELDSLTQVYYDNDELTVSERRRVGEALERAAMRLGALSSLRGSPESRARLLRGTTMSIQIAPMMPAQASAQMSRALSQLQATQAAMPRGWIGIVAEGPGEEPRIDRGQLIIRYLSYPRIMSVDPSSPAQRAGLSVGDTLLAYNGRDVRENDISLTTLLRPSTRVSVRVLRDSRVREIPVIVAPVPSRVELRRDNEIHEARAPWAVVGVPNAPSFPRSPVPLSASGGGVVGGNAARVFTMRPGVAPMPPVPASPALAPSGFAMAFANGVAGAQLLTITEGLGRTLGVGSGVLVTASPVGSPANESGLLDGDVILKVAGRAVQSVPQVRELIALAVENGERSVELETLRERRMRRLVLRW